MGSLEKGSIWLTGPETEIVEVTDWLEEIGFDVEVASNHTLDDGPETAEWSDCALILHDDQSPDATAREIDRARSLPGNPPIIVLGNESELTKRLEDRIDIVFLESPT